MSILSEHSKKDISLLNDEIPKRQKTIVKRKIVAQQKAENSTRKTLPLLQNGTKTCDYFNNTCTLDSLLQSLAVAVEKQLSFGSSPQNRTVRLLKNILDNNLKEAYNLRKQLLIQIFGQTKNCNSNIMDVAEDTLVSFPSVVVKFKCPDCLVTFTENRNCLYVNLWKLKNAGISKISNCLDEIPLKSCRNCQKIMSIEFCEYQNIISIYTENSSLKTSTIADIEPRLILASDIYELASIVGYKKIGDGHYISYGNRDKKWEKYDDLSSYVPTVRNTSQEKIDPHLIIYSRII